MGYKNEELSEEATCKEILQVQIDGGLSLDVRVGAEKETIWHTQAEMAELFDVDRTRIVCHL